MRRLGVRLPYPSSIITMIIFAHRGAPRIRQEDNTLAAFERALALGADGLESDIALTRDGLPVLAHPRPWRRDPPISRLRRDQLPASIPLLDDLYAHCGSGFDLSLDMGHPEAIKAVIEIAEKHDALNRLWLTYWRLPTLANWRQRWPDLHLVYATMPVAPRRLARTLDGLATHRIDAINIIHWLSTARLVEHAHARGMLAFAWGVRRPHQLHRLAAYGIDGVFLDMDGPIIPYDGNRRDLKETRSAAEDHPRL